MNEELAPSNKDSIQNFFSKLQERINRRIHFAAGEEIFRTGMKRDNAYIIETGAVSISIPGTNGGEESQVAVLGEGEIFGEMALVDDGNRTASAVAVEDSMVYVISRDALRVRLVGLDPLVGLLISLLVERYRIARIIFPEAIQTEAAQEIIDIIRRSDKSLNDDVKDLRDASVRKEIALKELDIEDALHQALAEKQLTPYLQPIVDLKTRKVVAFEALVRWFHPERGMIPPDKFVPVAERTGLVRWLDHTMLEEVCKILSTLNKHQDENPFVIAVNISGSHFIEDELVDMVRACLAKYNVHPSTLKLEITESALIEDPEKAQRNILTLKAIGVPLALDDFGTGYASLTYLHKFAIDDIKIDRSFVADLRTDARSIEIVRAIAGLASAFNMGSVAEGVEEESDIELLINAGCKLGQGYHFAKPMPVNEALALIKRDK